MYDSIQQEIEKYENKIMNCENEVVLQFYIKQIEALREQQKIVLQPVQQMDFSQLLLKKVTTIEKRVNQLCISKIKELDIWPGNRTQIEQLEFKDKLISHYECGYPNQNTIKCMVLNKYFNRNVVRASHIWRYCTQGVGLNEFGLRYSDLNSYRNGLLLYTSIEQAFDCKQLCFCYNPFQGKLVVKILHKGVDGIMDNMVLHKNDQSLYKDHTRFKDIDGKPLTLPENIYPFRRLLNWHSRCAHEYAKTKKWIPEDDNFSDFYDLSDLISLPGDDLNEQEID